MPVGYSNVYTVYVQCSITITEKVVFGLIGFEQDIELIGFEQDIESRLHKSKTKIQRIVHFVQFHSADLGCWSATCWQL